MNKEEFTEYSKTEWPKVDERCDRKLEDARDGGDEMTNFERWREGLKPEDLLRDDEKSSYKQSIFESCSVCPAHKFCDEWYKEFGDVADMAGFGSCENLFNEWANTKAEGGMDYEALAKKVAERLDKMTDEELNKDFRDYCGLTDEDFKEENPNETA